jgi:hypothetical protein
VSKRDQVWTRLRPEKPTLAKHEIINVAVAVFGRELACEIANLFKIRAKTLWVGHVANSRRYHAPGSHAVFHIYGPGCTCIVSVADHSRQLFLHMARKMADQKPLS